jgi:UDP-N-acetylmuramoyl-tripeptide--D-alanyl-D-alanine ligase
MNLVSVKAAFRPVERRCKKRFLTPAKDLLRRVLAHVYRLAFGLRGNVLFIGITGSCGKTTTTELVATILATQGPVRKCSHVNTTDFIARTILGVSGRHHFCVSEVGGGSPRLLERSARLLRPQIAVVTNIAQDHYGDYRTLEATAADKGRLVEVLPRAGVAVLNADDPHVLPMRSRTAARVITYGLSAEAMIRGEHVSCHWPARLSLDASYAGRSIRIQTRLLGEHWAAAVLAAVATGIAAGIPFERAAEAVQDLESTPYRMCPHTTPDGITFISDNWKAPLWAVPASMDFMKKAAAARKIAIVGSISDTPKGFYERYKAVARQALDAVEAVLFVGKHALTALRARRAPQDERIMAFPTIRKLNAFLDEFLQPGDLVLLKGVENNDHLQRIVLSRFGHVACWNPGCVKKRYCDDCRLLRIPSARPDEELSPDCSE